MQMCGERFSGGVPGGLRAGCLPAWRRLAKLPQAARTRHAASSFASDAGPTPSLEARLGTRARKRKASLLMGTWSGSCKKHEAADSGDHIELTEGEWCRMKQEASHREARRCRALSFVPKPEEI